MNFKGTLRGVTYTDAKEFAAAVKAQPPLEPFTRGGKAVTVKMGPQSSHRNGIKARPVFVKPKVTLTAAEREWLGAAVRRSDGREGQVWALAPSVPGAPLALWLVADGEVLWANSAFVTVLQSRVDQLALDV